jgi:hypothetical protein
VTERSGYLTNSVNVETFQRQRCAVDYQFGHRFDLVCRRRDLNRNNGIVRLIIVEHDNDVACTPRSINTQVA